MNIQTAIDMSRLIDKLTEQNDKLKAEADELSLDRKRLDWIFANCLVAIYEAPVMGGAVTISSRQQLDREMERG